MNLARLYAAQICPACGNRLEFTPWAEGAAEDRPCPCCGVHFGLDDADLIRREMTYRRWRRQWISYGKRWWSAAAPPDFDPEEQLRRLEQLAEDLEWPGAH